VIHFFASAASGSIQVCRAKETSSPPTTTIDDRNAPSYDRTATLDRIEQNLSVWRGSAALKPQILPGPWRPRSFLQGIVGRMSANGTK
jgi:hypothetical protein